MGHGAQADDVAHDLVAGHGSVDGAVEDRVQQAQGAGAEDLRLGGEPPVNVVGGEVAQFPGSEVWLCGLRACLPRHSRRSRKRSKYFSWGKKLANGAAIGAFDQAVDELLYESVGIRPTPPEPAMLN